MHKRSRYPFWSTHSACSFRGLLVPTVPCVMAEGAVGRPWTADLEEGDLLIRAVTIHGQNALVAPGRTKKARRKVSSYIPFKKRWLPSMCSNVKRFTPCPPSGWGHNVKCAITAVPENIVPPISPPHDRPAKVITGCAVYVNVGTAVPDIPPPRPSPSLFCLSISFFHPHVLSFVFALILRKTTLGGPLSGRQRGRAIYLQFCYRDIARHSYVG